MRLSKKSNYTSNFAVLYFINYFAHAFISSQRKTFLIETDYSIDQIALIYAVIPIVQIIIQIVVGYLSDKYLTIKKPMIILTVLSAITAYMFYSVSIQLFVFHFAIGVLSQSLSTSVTELSDVWVLSSPGPSSKNYAFIRAFGSAGWAVGSYLLALVISGMGYSGVAIVSLLLNVILLGVMAFTVDSKKSVDIEETKDASQLSEVIALFKDHYYLLAILIVFFINMAINMTSYVIIDKFLILGGTAFTISMRGVVAATSEIPVLLVGDKIIRKLGTMRMLIIGLVAYALQFAGYYFAKTNTVLLWITALQCISQTFFNVSIKYLLLDMSPDNLKTTGQLTGPAIVNGVTSIAYPIIAAFLMTTVSYNAPFILATILTIIGLIITLILSNKYAQVKKARVAHHL